MHTLLLVILGIEVIGLITLLALMFHTMYKLGYHRGASAAYLDAADRMKKMRDSIGQPDK